jgi:pimeloyl-ACP methyl ester carboxylesterase
MPLELIGSVFGERFGAGPVLALHGWGRSRLDFASILRATGGLAVDLPGFGATPPPAEALGAAGYAALLEPALDSLGGPAVVVGHSFGGRVAVHLALRRPETVGALVLAGTPLVRLQAGRRRVAAGYRALRAGRRLHLVSEEAMERARQRHGSADYRSASGVMREILVRVIHESYEEQLAALTCPVDLVWGAEDREVPPTVAEKAVGMLRLGSLTILSGVGHDLPAEAPTVMVARIEEHKHRLYRGPA